jgi:hypothetical protein
MKMKENSDEMATLISNLEKDAQAALSGLAPMVDPVREVYDVIERCGWNPDT